MTTEVRSDYDILDMLRVVRENRLLIVGLPLCVGIAAAVFAYSTQTVSRDQFEVKTTASLPAGVAPQIIFSKIAVAAEGSDHAQLTRVEPLGERPPLGRQLFRIVTEASSESEVRSAHGAFLQQLETEALVGAPTATDLADVEAKIKFVSDLWREMSMSGRAPTEPGATPNEVSNYALAVSSTLSSLDSLAEKREEIVDRMRGIELEVKTFGPFLKEKEISNSSLNWVRIPIICMAFTAIALLLYLFAKDAVKRAKRARGYVV